MPQPFNPLDFLKLARDLATNPDDAKLRAAVNRAYYALFLIARDKAGITGPQDVHKRTVTAVKQRTNYLATGNDLDQLRILRIEADYCLIPSKPLYNDWVANWTKAEQIIHRVLPKLQAW